MPAAVTEISVNSSIYSQEKFGLGDNILVRMIYLVPSTSVFIDSQVPDFVRSDHPKFVEFMKAYYDWMSIPNNTSDLSYTIKKNQDIDTAEDDYAEMLHREFLPLIPRDLKADRKKILKYARHFYRAKGTENSFRLFFRMLYDTGVEFYYPRTDVLKASDGKWTIEKSLRVIWDSKEPPEFDNKVIVGQTSKCSAFVDRAFFVKTEHLEAQELFLNIHGITGKFIPNEVIVTQDGHRGRITPVISTIEFSQNPLTKNPMTGSGYQLNDEFHVTDDVGHHGKIKVVSVDTTGAIRRLSVSSFGLNYQNTVTLVLNDSTATKPVRYAISNNSHTFEYTLSGDVVSLLVSNFASKDSADRAAENFIENSFVKLVGTNKDVDSKDEILMHINKCFRFRDTEIVFHLSFVTDRDFPQAFDIDSFQSVVGQGAKVKISSDALCVYPGYYINNNGQLSASKYLHDNNFYQQYSYRLYSSESSDTYRIYLNSLLHPLGLKFFAGFRDPTKVSAKSKTMRGAETKRVLQPFSPYDKRDVELVPSLRKNRRLPGGILSTSIIKRDDSKEIVSSTIGPSNRSLYRERFNSFPRQYELLNQDQATQTINAPSVCVYDSDTGTLIEILDVPNHDVLTTVDDVTINYWGDPSTPIGQYANMQMYLFNSVVPKSLEVQDVPDVVIFKNGETLVYDQDYIVHHKKTSRGYYQMKLIDYTINTDDTFYVSFKDKKGEVQIRKLPSPKILQNQNEFFEYTDTQEIVLEVPHAVAVKGPNSRINMLPEATITKGN